MAFTPADITLAITKATQDFAETTNKPTDEYIVNIRKVMTPVLMKVNPYEQLKNHHSLDGVVLIEYRYKHIHNQGQYVVPPVVSVYNVTINANTRKTIVKRAELAHEAKLSNRVLYDAANARLEDLTFPKNRKLRETTRVRSPNLRICAVDANDITRTYGSQSIRK